MEKQELEVGDILQINPNHERFPGMLLICTEHKPWGCQGYLMSSRDFEAYKFLGRAFLRVKWEDMEYCGKLEWIEMSEEENDDRE